jgi:hypothetical protein
MILGSLRISVSIVCLVLWSCVWGNSPTTKPVKEASITSDGSGHIIWLDNQHVMYLAHNKLFYVWDVDRNTMVEDSRFLQWRPRVHFDTGEISANGRRYKNYDDSEGSPISPAPPGTCINPVDGQRCKTNSPPWVVPGGGPNGHTSTSKIPLRERDGYLDRGIDGQDTINNFPILYYRSDIPEPISLGLGSMQVSPRVTYLPFADAYLLEGDRSNAALAYPLWLLFPDGRVQQIFDPTGMAWAQHSNATEKVTKRGVIFVRSSLFYEQVSDAGIYFLENGKLMRIVEGIFQFSTVSPNGCRLAVIRRRLGESLHYEERYVVQAFDLC